MMNCVLIRLTSASFCSNWRFVSWSSVSRKSCVPDICFSRLQTFLDHHGGQFVGHLGCLAGLAAGVADLECSKSAASGIRNLDRDRLLHGRDHEVHIAAPFPVGE